MASLQSVIQWFMPDERRFFDHAVVTAEAASRASELFVALTRASGRAAQLELVEQIQAAESAGDDALRVMADALDATYVTPIDREDLYQLASSLEIISDYVSATANHLTVHQMDTLPLGTAEMAQILHKAAQLCTSAVRLLKTMDQAGIRSACKQLQLLEHEADVTFRIRLGELFATEKDAIMLIKHKEFLEGLEDSVDRCAHVGTVLEAILIKNG
jgi:uncharacterized protein Yka (UPF0111/DUF47 family)